MATPTADPKTVTELLTLRGKVALITGATGRLGSAMADALAQDGVRVNCLSPGPFPPPRIPEALVERLSAKSPMWRMDRPEELKGALVFLASPADGYMTGQNLIIDGGWTAW